MIFYLLKQLKVGLLMNEEQELGTRLRNAFLSRNSNHPNPVLSRTKPKAMLIPGERRDVAVLFLDLSGFTAFSETLDHETVHMITKSLMDELVSTAEQHSGYVDKIEGDRIMILFGAIRSSENDSRNAILCGLKMLKVVELASSILSKAGVTLSARIGINSGPVTVAPDAIDHLTAMGNTVNIASRMEENAGENTILVTDTVYSNCSENILWDKSRELNIRGIGVPIVSWRPISVNYRTGHIPCHESLNTVFVSRDAEYSLLLNTLKLQRERASGKNRMGGARHLIVELSGDAGTGKTRLVSEFLKNENPAEDSIILRGNSIADAQPAHWLWSVLLQNLLNIQIENSIPYDCFLEAISPYCQVNKLTGALPFLGQLVSANSDDIRLKELGNKAIATETKMAVRDLLESLSEVSPVIVVLEDLQWLDSTDSAILDFVLKNCCSVNPIMFLLVRRSDHKNLLSENICKNSAYSIYKSIELSELEMAEVIEFTEKFLYKLSGSECCTTSTEAIEFIHRHSSGNPFFLQELILHLVESGGLLSIEGVWTLSDKSVEFSTPGSLKGLLQSRLDRLPDTLRKTLLNCSVFGMEFRHDLYRSVERKLGITPCEEEVFNGLVERQFLEKTPSEQDISYVFHHSFIQSTAYKSILSHNLKLLHKAVAESMEEIFSQDSERVSAKLADHWERAGEISSAIEWGIIAQKHAANNYQYDSVLMWGRKIDIWLSSRQNDPDVLLKLLGVLKRNSTVLQFTQKWEDLQILLARMHDIALTNQFTEWVAKLEIAMGDYYTAIRDMDNASAHLQKSLTISRKNNFPEIESNALISLGVIAGMHRDFDQARECFEGARVLFTNSRNLRGQARALGNLGILHRNLGESDKAISLLEEILGIFREIGDVRNEAITLGNLGSMYQDRNDSPEAEDLFKNAIEIFGRLGERIPEGIFLCNLGNSLREKKLFEESKESYSRAMEIVDEVGDKRTLAWIMSNLGLQYIFEGKLEEAEELYSRSLQMFTEIEDEVNQAITLSGIGYIQYLTGREDSSVAAFTKAHSIISKLKLPPMEFSATFIKLYNEMIADKDSGFNVPWPEHWQKS